MSDQSQPPGNDRFKAEMPQIPGVASGGDVPPPAPAGRGRLLVVAGALLLLATALFGGRLISKAKRGETPVAKVPPVAATDETPAAVADLPVPAASLPNPLIAQLGQLGKAWDSRKFSFRDRVSGENVPALLIRLPGGSAGQAGGYWAFALKAAYGRCQLEYVDDLAKLRSEYGYRAANHPMVGNPCTRTVYDPLRYGGVSGGVLARGAIVQGTDLRPPLGIEVKVRGKDIVAGRME